ALESVQCEASLRGGKLFVMDYGDQLTFGNIERLCSGHVNYPLNGLCTRRN
ncbi:MAG: hypothetical protein ACI8PT_003988, partial [Gammaproteobacteria bacterium]